ncbi:hypothetical protein RIF29_15659 [Crotalaria pallida]|uniref:Uncharacterized protein n=1 Tax=Crotalaria pallida TaxID=3830 RepID=A0AAN9FM86_CROPI
MHAKNMQQVDFQIKTLVHPFLVFQGGKKRSSFYYDLWNIKYLSKFKWDDLNEELAFKRAVWGAKTSFRTFCC